MASFSLQFHYLLIRTIYAVKLLERHFDVGIKNQFCVVSTVSMCSYSEIHLRVAPDSNTWSRPWPRGSGLYLGLKSLGLDVLASFNITVKTMDSHRRTNSCSVPYITVSHRAVQLLQVGYGPTCFAAFSLCLPVSLPLAPSLLLSPTPSLSCF